MGNLKKQQKKITKKKITKKKESRPMTALNEKKKHEGNNQIIWENEHARYLNLVKLKGCTLVITGLVMFSFSSFQQQIFKETKRIVFVFLVPPKLKRER